MVSFKDLAACVSVNTNELYAKFRVEPNRTTDVGKPPVGEKVHFFPYTMDAACILQEDVFNAADQNISHNKREVVTLPSKQIAYLARARFF